LAVLVVGAVLLAQHRLDQPIVAVHDLGEEIALHAVQAAVHLGLDVAMGRDHAVVLGRHHDAAAGAAEATRRLVPFELAAAALGHEIRRRSGRRHAAGGRRHRGSFELEHLTAIELPGHFTPPDYSPSIAWKTSAAE